MVGLAATSPVYETWFHNNYYDLNQLVTALIGSTVGPESYTISLIVIFFCLNILNSDCICDLSIPKINYLSINSQRDSTQNFVWVPFY